MNNVTSIPVNISCYVPQGSVLGPILFLLYIDDFHSCSDFFDFHLFADDTNLFSKHRSFSSLQAIIHGELINVNCWLCANKLSLNVEKSSFVVFHPIPNFDLTINGNYLSIPILVGNLKLTVLLNKSKGVLALSKLRYYVNITILINLYYLLIYPFLTYGILSWGNAYIQPHFSP